MGKPAARPKYGWGENHPLFDWLFAEPFAFDFVQAVRLLEIFAASTGNSSQRIGEGSDPSQEAVSLRAHMGFSAPPGQVVSLSRTPGDSSPPELTAAFCALAGAFGPLPDWVGELVLRHSQRQDDTLRDFFDLFHHRLLSLVYRAALAHRPWLAPALGGEAQAGFARAKNAMSQHLLAFMGLGLETLVNRSGVSDAELLPYAGLYWHGPRNIAGLQRILDHAFAERIQVLPMRGKWTRIEPDEYTRLGARALPNGTLPPAAMNPGRHRKLGRTSTLGTRFWNPKGRVELWVGPVPFRTLEQFMPGRPSYNRLHALVRSYAGELTEFHVHLLVFDAAHPGARLAWKTAADRKEHTARGFATARLGFTTLFAHRRSPPAPAKVHRVRVSPLPSRIP